MEMEKEILDRIDLLAKKLGVTAENLWKAMVKREVIRGYTSAATLILYIVAVFVCAFNLVGTAERWRVLTDFNGNSIFVGFSTFAYVLLGVAFFSEIPEKLDDALSGIVTPEGNAIEELLSALQ